jgi:periplasmic copper chaperone A
MRSALALAAATLAALAVAASASAHAHISPPVALAKAGQLFSLDVPTEKEGKTTTKIVLTLPQGFSIDSFVDAPGWKRQVQSTGSGESSVVQRVTWTGGHVPTDEISHFAFLASADSDKTYTFGVEQTYSDGSIVNWNGPESSDTPAPTVEAKSSLGGGGSSTLAIIALVVGVVGVVLGGVALVAKGGRQLA